MASSRYSTTEDELREQVRARYAAAATAVTDGNSCGCGSSDSERSCCETSSSSACCSSDPSNSDEPFGFGRYDIDQRDELPEQALLASLGCGNPVAVAELREGQRVLDLGSGGGIDVLLSARRVGPTGSAYGLDMTVEMLDLARRNATSAGMTNVEFLKGTIEDVPLADESVDVVISNCVINLSVDKPAVMAEMYRVLTPGGTIGIADMVADDDLAPAERAALGSYVGCIAGALGSREYLDGLAAVGFTDATVTLMHEAAPGMYAAVVKATKP